MIMRAKNYASGLKRYKVYIMIISFVVIVYDNNQSKVYSLGQNKTFAGLK